MAEINSWLERFKIAWETHDIEAVLKLFAENVVYYETPFKRLKNSSDLTEAWRAINEQKDISLGYEIFSEDGSKYSILWSLVYTDNKGKKQEFKGIYLIKLNNKGLCSYFYHTCEDNK